MARIVPAPGKVVEMTVGDITDLQEEVDVVVVSAFPDDYAPTPSSVIGALHRKGLDVASLAARKAVDLRANFACWLSEEVGGAWPFRRILCFEPLHKGVPADVVSDVFRSLAPFVAGPDGTRRVALPLLAAGDQGASPESMLRPLVGAACEWMKRGFQLERMLVVVPDPLVAERLAPLWEELRAGHEQAMPPAARQFRYHLFISYSRKDAAAADAFVAALRERRPELRIFVDRFELKTGSSWRLDIVRALDDCQRVVALYSPDYLASKMCQEEFNLAWTRRDEDERVLFPIYLRSAALPGYMRLIQYEDCREADPARLRAAARRLLDTI